MLAALPSSFYHQHSVSRIAGCYGGVTSALPRHCHQLGGHGPVYTANRHHHCTAQTRVTSCHYALLPPRRACGYCFLTGRLALQCTLQFRLNKPAGRIEGHSRLLHPCVYFLESSLRLLQGDGQYSPAFVTMWVRYLHKEACYIAGFIDSVCI